MTRTRDGSGAGCGAWCAPNHPQTLATLGSTASARRAATGWTDAAVRATGWRSAPRTRGTASACPPRWNEPQAATPALAPGPTVRLLSCRQVRRAQRKAEDPHPSSVWLGIWLGIGIAWVILSAIVWAYTDNAANTCRSALVGALDQSQCTTVTFWHDMAGISAVLGVLVIIFAGVAMSRGR